jgi:hypothetical protein
MAVETPGLFVTVVSGLPRSGTSMMMQMLAAGGMPVLTDSLRPPDPDNPRGYLEFEPARRTREDARWVADAAGKAVKLVHLLVPELPTGHTYRVVFMQRDLVDVLASQYAMLRRHGRPEPDLAPTRLAELFASQLRRVREWVAGQPDFAALDVEYASVIADPDDQASRLNRFLGGILDGTRMAAAVDPSMRHQQRAIGEAKG